LVPARVLGGAPEAVPTGTGRFDDLRLIIFGRARVIAFGLDLVLVMGASRGLRYAIRRTTSAPPRQVTRRGSAQKRASAASSQHSNARFAEECQSILSNMIALCLPAILTPYGAPLRLSRIRIPLRHIILKIKNIFEDCRDYPRNNPRPVIEKLNVSLGQFGLKKVPSG
jgi:hypothetical protein